MGKVWAGVAAGVLAGAILLGVGLAAFDAGRDSETTAQVVTADGQAVDGTVVHVVDDGWRGDGPGPGLFLLLAFLAFLTVVLVLVRRNPRWGRGPWGPGPWGPGPGPGAGPWDARRAYLDEWHRQAHAGGGAPTGPPPADPVSTGAA
jgi:hypothetical protein